jgi:hypothetical protein
MAEIKIEIDFTDYEIQVNEYVKSCFVVFKDAVREVGYGKDEIIDHLDDAIDEFDQRIAVCRAQQLLK